MSKSMVIRLKKDMRATTDLMELVDVLKRIAASQFQVLDKKRQSMRWSASDRPRTGGLAGDQTPPEPAGEASGGQAEAKSPGLSLTVLLEEFFRLIPPQECRHPFLEPASPPLGIVIVTSDEGFLGGLNATVIQQALSARQGRPSELMVVGERGRMYLAELNEPSTSFPGVGEHITSSAIEGFRDYIVKQYLGGKFGQVLVFYPLIKLWLTRKIHEIFWQSRLSELAARMMHLEASFQELSQQKRKQTLQYFRNAHEVTDTSIRESYAGVLGRKKQMEAGR
jgi:hypothetical protein